ncbi:MAG: Mu transposase C-terminal domain-containing protein [Desulfuromonadales bacterium]|nr:Mu transposase C-terminal domain-containing protein [Desulfuromonadales bacterium]MDW7758709.1 Mu transposase C-terminal domain-containing protein [Desulfuromonadales bacterium]
MKVKTSDIVAALCVSKQAVNKRAAKQGWQPLPERVKGGGKVYLLAELPLTDEERASVRNYLQNKKLIQLMDETEKHAAEQVETAAETALVCQEEAEVPAVIAVPDLGSLKNWQQRVMDARLAFMRLIERAPEGGVTLAIDTLVKKSRTEELPPFYQALVPMANARAGKEGKRALSKRTLMRWWSDYKKSGGKWASLAPKKVEKDDIPAWAPAFLKLYRVPQKPSINHALEDLAAMLPEGATLPSESQVRRFLKKYSRLEVQRGRKSGSELRSQRIYRERDTDGLSPADVYMCDGHSFKADVAHPGHGRPFKPEVCTVIDAVTRVAVGWSAGLAESSLTVADALRHACTVNEEKPYGGIPAIFYTDNGGGNTAKINADEVAGLFPRLGVTFETGIAGNPQGRGMIERLNSSLWIPAAKKLATYTGKDMDSLVKRNVYLTLDKEVKAADREQRDVQHELLISWPEFLLFMADEVDRYNRRPHSSLPRITCPQTGRRRHMAPLEYWAEFVGHGWKPMMLDEHEIVSLFRPHEIVKCNRGMIRLWKQVYSDPVLEHYHGMELMAGYDVHDASKIWVRDLEGHLLVIAKRDAHKSKIFPMSKIELAAEQRYKNRMKNLRAKEEETELEYRSRTIETRPIQDVIEIEAEVVEKSEKIIARAAKKKKLFSSVWERYEDLCSRMSQGDATVTDYEKQWRQDYEHYTETGKRKGLFKEDEFCLKEQLEQAESK